MNESKNLLIVLGEWWEQRQNRPHSDVRGASPGRLGRVLRWCLPNGGTLLLVAVLILTQGVWARPSLGPAAAPGPSATTVNYQGRLADSGGNPLDGSYGMSFSLWDAASGGSLVWGPESHVAVPVSEGLFSVGLGSLMGGGIPTTTWDGDRYLEIEVGGETLSPRELIRSVPVAAMALTVPDGSIRSDNLDLDHGIVCREGQVQLILAGGYQEMDVPGLNLDFSLAKPSQVLVWMDGLASFDDGSSIGEAAIDLYVDGEAKVAAWHLTDDNIWFNVKGQRLLNLDSGTHSMAVKANAQHPGTMTVHGMYSHQTCINYLVLGEQ
jgi:hypothetical protein